MSNQFFSFTGNIHADNVMVKLKDVLPMYMVPNFCYKIIELPLKSNGKLNELNLNTISR